VQAGQAAAVVTAPVHVEASATSEQQEATTAAEPKVDGDEGVVLQGVHTSGHTTRTDLFETFELCDDISSHYSGKAKHM